ncbi:MAG TPA: GIY-YIG nuclease family protein [Candidatus Polarisedimenticolaceae bacterium]|nr:GIY-YIG nuclease family protein [Candidatus Polarisedimenticolaceae bacterium]
MGRERWYVYLIRTRGGNLYTGVATDVARRVAEHERSGARAARALRGKGPLRLVFQREIGERRLAQRVESRIKRLDRAGKEQLLHADPDVAQLLALLSLVADEPIVSGRTSRSLVRSRDGRPDRIRPGRG